MGIRAQVEGLFDEIESYSGNFGDPVATAFSFNPLTVLVDPEADEWVKLGASIALLVNFCVAADNTTYQQALQSSPLRDIDFALMHGLCKNFPVVVQAMLAAKNSEFEFQHSIRQVYVDHIKDWRLRGQNL